MAKDNKGGKQPGGDSVKGSKAVAGGVKKSSGGHKGSLGGWKSGAGGGGGGGKPNVRPTSAVPHAKLSAKERREAKRAKNSLKKNYDVIHEAAQLWESGRSNEILGASSQQEQVVQILKKIQGKILELSNHHTASRIIQFLLKHGDESQRKVVLKEVQASITDLSKSKYGHHLVRKLINVSKKDEVPGLVALFKGHIAELIRHPYGADVLMDLYDVASSHARTSMCAELYGREFVLFSGNATTNTGVQLTGGLKQLLEGVPAAKKLSVLQHMTKALTPVMEKALLHPPMVHRLLREFFECAPGSALEDAVDTLSQSGANVLKMVHTHDGASVCCMLLAYGSAKDRKRLVKAMKGLVKEMATNEWGHAVLCEALSVVDDTQMMHKSILMELKGMLSEAVNDPNAHKVITHLLSPDNRHYLTPAVLELMHPPERTVTTSGKMVTDIDGEEDEVDIHDMGGEEDDGEDLFQKKGPKKSGKGFKSLGKQENGDEEAGPRVDDEEDKTGDRPVTRVLGVSKKDSLVRRKELMGKGAGLGQALVEVCTASVSTLIRSPYGSHVLHEVVRGGDDGVLAELCPEGVRSVHGALVEQVSRDPEDMEEGVSGGGAGPSKPMEHVMVHYFGSRALRRMVLSSAEGPCNVSSCAFVESLWSEALEGRCGRWMGTHGMKVLASLLHCGSASVRSAAAKELKPLVKGPLEEWAKPMVTVMAKGGDKGGGKEGKSGGKAAEATPAKAGKGGKAVAKAAAVEATPVKAEAKKAVKAPATAPAKGSKKTNAPAAKAPASAKKPKH